jgi:hypothetical protein
MATVTTHKHAFTAKKSPRLFFIAECFRLKNVRTAQTFRSGNTCERREDSEDREPRIARMKMFSREKNMRERCDGNCLVLQSGTLG